MSTAWRAENGLRNRNAAGCSYVPVSLTKSGRVENFDLGPPPGPRWAGGHGASGARGARSGRSRRGSR